MGRSVSYARLVHELLFTVVIVRFKMLARKINMKVALLLLPFDSKTKWCGVPFEINFQTNWNVFN